MSIISELIRYREDILHAEIAGCLHNLGKLDPNFLVIQTGESLNALEFHRIPPSDSSIKGQYTFKRFSKPSLLESNFHYKDLLGVLYLPDASTRKIIENRVKQIEEEISAIQGQLSSLTSSEEKKSLGRTLNMLKQERLRALQGRDDLEKNAWKQYEQQFEAYLFSDLGSWPLGSLLTMFWESEWFDKPSTKNYKPGSNNDPDYQRSPKKEIKLKPGFSMDLPALLLLAHGEVSGQEKKGMDTAGNYVDIYDYKSPKPTLDTLRLATAFGYESPLCWEDWQQRRKDIVDWVLANWNTPTRTILELEKRFEPFVLALGDTQRPINEISLWAYSKSTASLFKTAIAEYFFTSQMPTPATMRWRLASVRMDALKFLFQSTMLSDLLGRQSLLKDVQKIIRHALEVEIPAGSEVYADEHGSVFVLPEFQGLDEKSIENELTDLLEGFIDKPAKLTTLQNAPQVYGVADIRPKIQLGSPQRGKALNLQQALPDKEPINAVNPKLVAHWWNSAKTERCTVCGLRPVGYLEAGLPGFVNKEKAEERHLCGICLARRGRRAQEWTGKMNDTIWIDETADVKAQLALIIGKFDLSYWIDGTLVRTLAVGTDANGAWFAKAPTFSRVRRIWETTQSFWQDVCPTDEKPDLAKKPLVEKTVHKAGPRLEIRGRPQPKGEDANLGPYHAYDLVLPNGLKLSVAWDPEDGKSDYPKGRLISIDNLVHFASLAGEKAPSKEKYESEDVHRWAAERSKRLIQGILRIEEPTGYGGKAKEWGEMAVESVSIISNSQYTPAIPILAEPRTFMALVPADKALEVAKAIKTKYEREMGKVRNRLPLHLGIVYAHRRTPLRAILDSGRRMLDQTAKPEGWKVVCAARKLVDRNDQLPDRFGADKEGQFKEWLEILLEKDGRRVSWLMPAVMGDGRTLDQWYPYVFLNGSSEPADRDRRFKAPNPWTSSDDWLVHAADLKPDDLVYFTPATLDFQWLDSAGRRFEISYDDCGQRRSMPRRPYLLDELESLNEIWETLRHHLNKNQIYILRDLIEARREDWQVKTPTLAKDDVFWRFCRDALANAEWKKGKLPWETEGKDREDWLGQWADYAARGWLADVVELHLQIMKEEVLG